MAKTWDMAKPRRDQNEKENKYLIFIRARKDSKSTAADTFIAGNVNAGATDMYGLLDKTGDPWMLVSISFSPEDAKNKARILSKGLGSTNVMVCRSVNFE